MASFRTQFHALLEELVDFVETWMDKYPITATVIEFPPHRERALAREDIGIVFASPKIIQVVFTQVPVDFTAGDKTDVIEQCPGSLVLNIGRIGSRGLEQSALGTMDANPIWRKINSDLKRKATTGADFLHEENGAKGVERNFRFTPGARALSKAGTPLRAFAQSAVVYYPK